ncbi:MAG TPA: hypothetical protein VFQ65_18675, partial [Kofleriaceae bacterium]|nr:hypothetical protein [Kofleriaceae bacterium]
MRILCLLGLAACTTGSPLTRIGPQVEIHVDPMHDVAVSITTWNDLAALRDAMTAGEITTTLDGQPLLVDVGMTGTFDAGDRYVAAFATAPEASRATPSPPPASSTIAISDGTTTWTARVDHMFTNDLAPTAPLAAGTNVFEWPSAASATPYSTIAWACVEVSGASAACERDQVSDPNITISKQFITATIAGASGDRIDVTGE